MPQYASPPPYVWHKFESLRVSYSTMPTFVPPTPPVLVPPLNPFALPSQPEPEPKALDDEKNESPSQAEGSVSGESPGMSLECLELHHG